MRATAKRGRWRWRLGLASTHPPPRRRPVRAARPLPPRPISIPIRRLSPAARRRRPFHGNGNQGRPYPSSLPEACRAIEPLEIGLSDCLQRGARHTVWPQILGVVHGEQASEAGARPVDAALDRTNGAAADGGGLLVGKTGRSNEQQRLALVMRQFGERRTEVLEVETCSLLGLYAQAGRVGTIRVLHLAPALTIFRVEQVAQDREQPSVEVGAPFEAVDVRQGAQQGVLNEIVGPIHLAGQRNCECAQTWDRGEQSVADGRFRRHQITPPRAGRGGRGGRRNGRGPAVREVRRTWRAGCRRCAPESHDRGWVQRQVLARRAQDKPWPAFSPDHASLYVPLPALGWLSPTERAPLRIVR